MKTFTIISILSALFSSTQAFAPSLNRGIVAQSKNLVIHTGTSAERLRQNGQVAVEIPAAIKNQRQSMAQIQTMGLFGLGGPEIAIILIAAAFLLGPQKLAELGKDAGKIAGELKEVPKEFQKGLQEGEEEALKLKNDMTAKVEDVEVKKE